MVQAIDYDRAVTSPASVFERPEDVVGHPALTPRQKIEILRRWEYDESDIAVATEEGMPGGESVLLRRILLALEQLPGGVDLEHASPTKQHGPPSPAKERT